MPTEIINTTFYRNANMQGYWRLESDGSDSSSNGYTLSGTAPTYTSGMFGNGGDFESGSSQYISIADASCPNLEISGAKSICCWVKLESIPVNDMSIVAKCDAGASTFYTLQILGTGGADPGKVKWSSKNGNSITSDGALSTGVWYFLGATHNGTTGLALHVDTTRKTNTSGAATTDTNGDFAIGRLGSFAGQYFDGLIDDVAIFNAELTQSELDSLYNDTGSRKGFILI